MTTGRAPRRAGNENTKTTADPPAVASSLARVPCRNSLVITLSLHATQQRVSLPPLAKKRGLRGGAGYTIHEQREREKYIYIKKTCRYTHFHSHPVV